MVCAREQQRGQPVTNAVTAVRRGRQRCYTLRSAEAGHRVFQPIPHTNEAGAELVRERRGPVVIVARVTKVGVHPQQPVGEQRGFTILGVFTVQDQGAVFDRVQQHIQASVVALSLYPTKVWLARLCSHDFATKVWHRAQTTEKEHEHGDP